MDNKLNCVKYNYSLEEGVQNFKTFQAYVQLSHDGEELIIKNRKIQEKLVHSLEEDEKRIME